MIRFACPSCGATYGVDDSKGGKAAKCPKCQTQFQIPAAGTGAGPPAAPPPPPAPSAVILPPPAPPPPVDPNAPVEINPCPGCQARLAVSPADLGADVECPYCKRVYKAVRSGSVPSPPAPSSRRRSAVDDDDVIGDLGRRQDDGDRPTRRRRDEDEDDRPSRRGRRDEDDEFDDRPSRRGRRPVDDDEDRPSRRRRDDDDDDDRPRRRSRRDDYDDEDDYDDRPRRRGGRRREEAEAAVAAPAVILIVLGILGLLYAGFNVFAYATGLGDEDPDAPLFGPPPPPRPAGQPPPPPPPKDPAEQVGEIVGVCMPFLWGGLVTLGGFKMKTLSNHGLAMTGAVFAMLPCSPCCLLGLPFGIWAITVLNQPHVKRSFG